MQIYTHFLDSPLMMGTAGAFSILRENARKRSSICWTNVSKVISGAAASETVGGPKWQWANFRYQICTPINSVFFLLGKDFALFRDCRTTEIILAASVVLLLIFDAKHPCTYHGEA